MGAPPIKIVKETIWGKGKFDHKRAGFEQALVCLEDAPSDSQKDKSGAWGQADPGV